MLNGFFFNTPIDTNFIGHQVAEIYKDGVYNQFLSGKHDLTILDVGGNIGIASYYFSQFAKVVHAFEPTQEHFDVLKHQVEFNKLTNVIPHKVALSNFDGVADFHINPQNRTMNSLNPAPGFKTIIEKVVTVRLDTFFKQENIEHVDFMKVDIEGSEAEVICGDAFQSVGDKIDMLFLELHSWANRNPEQIKEGLRAVGLKNIETIPNDAQLWVATR